MREILKEQEKNNVKEFEENITEGWTIYPPEHTLKARHWIKTIEAVILPAGFRDEGETEGESKTGNALDRESDSLRKGEKYS